MSAELEGFAIVAVIVIVLLAAGVAALFWWIYHRPHNGHRLAVVHTWHAIDPPETCQDCGGWGVTRLDGTAFPPGSSIQHAAFSAANKPDCKSCLGQGTRPRRLPAPASYGRKRHG